MCKSVLFGICIGDGYISSKNRLIIRHGSKQKDYILFKKNRIESILKRSINIYTYKYNGYECYQFGIGHPYFKCLRKWIYKNNKKYISKNVLSKMDEEAIAFWYMDDGSLSAKKRKGIIHAYELSISTYCSEKEVENIISFFKEKFNIKFTKRKNKGFFCIRCGTKEARKFIKIVSPFICDSMFYKINMEHKGCYNRPPKVFINYGEGIVQTTNFI